MYRIRTFKRNVLIFLGVALTMSLLAVIIFLWYGPVNQGWILLVLAAISLNVSIEICQEKRRRASMVMGSGSWGGRTGRG